MSGTRTARPVVGLAGSGSGAASGAWPCDASPSRKGSEVGSRLGPWRGRWQRARAWAAQPGVKRSALVVFLLLVLALLVRGAQAVPWPQVWQALGDTPAWRLAAAAGLALAGYAVYASFDLIGRRLVGHGLPKGPVVAVAAGSYALNQNLGYLIGGVGMRLRLYGALGLQPAQVAGVAGVSALTNWLGHFTAFGLLLIVGREPLPSAWGVGPTAWTGAGAAALAVVAAYLCACRWSGRREWQLGSLNLRLPRLPLALTQLAAGVSSWLLMGAVLWVALPANADFTAVTCALMVAAVAGAIAHVPAGMGVLEAVTVALLAPAIAPHQVLAAVLVYRAAYQWLPGLLAGAGLLVFEQARRGGTGADAAAVKAGSRSPRS